MYIPTPRARLGHVYYLRHLLLPFFLRKESLAPVERRTITMSFVPTLAPPVGPTTVTTPKFSSRSTSNTQSSSKTATTGTTSSTSTSSSSSSQKVLSTGARVGLGFGIGELTFYQCSFPSKMLTCFLLDSSVLPVIIRNAVFLLEETISEGSGESRS
ncbi:hypothetical protein EV702DRAFT_1101851 [Suillus placidus]|uniref:Uncharacterized protein n=1 Tax=Suillus placidus TaxID=48579 RepID=A0A9P6ZVQ1_9AGAM|nr:hypothetical protein EV702DRAFT_1101851 [Suillus placidus]